MEVSQGKAGQSTESQEEGTTSSLLPPLRPRAALQMPSLLTDGRKLVPAKPSAGRLINTHREGRKREGGEGCGVEADAAFWKQELMGRGGKLLLQDKLPSPQLKNLPPCPCRDSGGTGTRT